MKSIELLNICYKFFNQYINAKQMIELLDKLDNDDKEFKDFLSVLKEKEKNVPNKEDELVKAKKNNIQDLLDRFRNVDLDDELIGKQIKNLKDELKREYDCYERWFAIVDFINSNDYFNKCFDSLNKSELLEFITQYIKAPFPPQLTQEEFDSLVKEGISKDDRESLWRLAFNYDNYEINLDKVLDYFIEVKDAYYIVELISAVREKVNIDAMIDKITDKKLIDDLKEREDIIKGIITEEQFNRLFNK